MGRQKRLEPILRNHAESLLDVTRDGELWRICYTAVPAPYAMLADIDRRLLLQAEGSLLPFTVFGHATGEAVGMATYMNIDSTHRRVEIGSTWYAARMQSNGLNTEAQRLLLAHAVDTLA